jgi:hypothetical protein
MTYKPTHTISADVRKLMWRLETEVIIALIWNKVSTRFQRLCPCFRCCPFWIPRTAAQSVIDRCQKTNMAVGEPEVVKTLVRNKTSRRFQRRLVYFWCQPIKRRIQRHRPVSISFSGRTYFRFRCKRLSSRAAVGAAVCRSMRHSIVWHRKYVNSRWNPFDILFLTKVITTSGSPTTILVFCHRPMIGCVVVRGIQ